MQKINNVSIALLVVGGVFLAVITFLLIVGFQSKPRKRLWNCLAGTIYVAVLVTITICKEEYHWMEGKAEGVKLRIWSYDLSDSKANVGVHAGLKGVNVTLVMPSAHANGSGATCMFNERFSWNWGTKLSMLDGKNPYKRVLESAVSKGLPLPLQDLAQRYETYGVMGPATPGLGLHETGFYTDLCLTIALGGWVATGVLPPLSLFGSFYASLATCLALVTGMLINVIINFSYGIMERSETHYQLFDSDSKCTLKLRYAWCFYVNLVMIVVTGIMSYVIRLQAIRQNEKQLKKLQFEIEEAQLIAAERLQKTRTNKNNPNRVKLTKRRLTAVFSRGDSVSKGIIKINECPASGVVSNINAVPISHVIETGLITSPTTPTIQKIDLGRTSSQKSQRPSMTDVNVVECDVDYTGEETTMTYGKLEPMQSPSITKITPLEPTKITSSTQEVPPSTLALATSTTAVSPPASPPYSPTEGESREEYLLRKRKQNLERKCSTKPKPDITDISEAD